MRANVFSDAALARQAGRFVWLSINTEEAVNAAFLERVEIDGLPTFLVFDSRDEQPVLRWLGSATVPQIEKLLDDGERAVRGEARTPAEEALARADRLNGAGKSSEAARGYEEALRASPEGWERRTRAVESLVFALQGAGELEPCARVAREETGRLPRGSSFANVSAVGLMCAMEAPEKESWREAALSDLEQRVRESLEIEGILADDRSGLYQLLVERRRSAGDASNAKALAERWMTFLETETDKAPTPEARAAFDSHRVSAALELKDPARALPALQASERDLPSDYNPLARLAILYRELGRLDEALTAADRALAKVSGPRKLRVYDLQSDILLKKGDRDAAKRALDSAVAYGQSLPAGQRPDSAIALLEKKRRELG